MTVAWRVLADVVVGVHYAFLLYLLVGGFLAQRRPGTIWLHLAAAVWGTLIVTTRVPCPLTAAQDLFRRRGGLAPLHGGFIGTYVKGVLYPARWETATQVVVALLVAGSWVAFLRHRQTRRGLERSRSEVVPSRP